MMKAESEGESRVSGSGEELESLDLAAVGRRIRSIRGSEKSQSAFAREMDVGISTLQRYEKGERPPEVEFLWRLWRLRDADPLWVITGEKRNQELDLDLDLIELIVKEVRATLSDLTVDLPPEKEAKVCRLLYQLFKEREQRPDTRTVAEIIQLVA